MAAVTQQDLTALTAELTAYTDACVQLAFIMLCAFAIVFMQAGFAMLEAGGCRSKNSKSILYKNGIDLSIGVMIWWFWGFGFASADNENNAIRHFDGDLALSFLITVAFCTTAATIVSGAVAERINFWVYVISTITIAGGSYPLISQWIWVGHNSDFDGSGWLRNNGVVDFAGSGVVHLLGATAAIVSAWWIGPRVGRFIKNADGTTTAVELKASDPILCTIGTWILIFGWLSFNASSSGGYGLDSLHVSARAVVMTLIAMAAGGFSSTVLQIPNHKLDLGTLNNAFLGSLVAITAPCAHVDAVGAFFIGLIGGMIALVGNKIPTFLRIDDPLDTFTVHGLNGAWGLVSVGLFGTREFMNGDFDYGCFYGGTGHSLGYQITAVIVIILVAGGVAFATMGLMYVVGKYVLQIPGENPLRISMEDEVVGLDIQEFGGYAYPEHEHQVELIMKKAAELGIDITLSKKEKHIVAAKPIEGGVSASETSASEEVAVTQA
jgi:ammonium transporter, Amt family